MTKQGAGGGRIPYLVVVAAVLVWGILGILDMSNAPYSGYVTTPQNVVNQVQAGGPAEAAGLMVGDRIESIGGISIEDTRGLNRAPRIFPGDVREFSINRDGQAMTVSLTYASLPGVQRAITWSAVVLGLAFLLLPYWVGSRVRSSPSRILAWFGVCFALSFLAGPYLASVTLRNLMGAVTLVAIVLGFALLLRFVLSFPSESAFLTRPSAKLWIWGPAAIIALMFVYLILAEPAATSGLSAIVNLLVVVFVVGYFGASLIVLINRYRSASAEVRASSGLSFMLWGAVIALVPLLVASLLGLVAPMLVLPGQQFYFLTLILIPVSFSLAVSKAAAADTGAEATA